MQLLVYVYHPDATPLMVEAFPELEEAIAVCHDLVAVDGYVRAEIWSESGERRFGVARALGGTLYTYGEPLASDDQGDDGPARATRSERALSRPVARETVEERPPVARPERGGARPEILGELPDRPEQWFGL